MRIFKKIIGSPLIQIAGLTALVLVGILAPARPWAPLENRNFDFWSTHFRSPGDQPIAIIAIDDKSLDRLGDWPWPRARLAEMIRLLTTRGAQALGIGLLYTQPYQSPGLAEIEALKEKVGDPQWAGGKKAAGIMAGLLDEAEARLDQDAQLISAVRRAQDAVLPLYFGFNRNPVPLQAGDKPSGLVIVNSLNVSELPSGTGANTLAASAIIGGGPRTPLVAARIRETFEALAAKAGALGHLNLVQDSDGVVRRLPLLIEYEGRLVPALALQLAMKYIDAPLRNLSLGLDFMGQPSLSAKHLELAIDRAYCLLLNHDLRWTRQRTFSFADVLDGSIDPAVFRNKIVLIGLTAPDAAPAYRVGTHSGVTPIEISANALGRILSSARLSRPSWGPVLEIVAVLYFAFFLVFFIPRMSFKVGAGLLAVFMLTWYAVVVGLLLGYGYWVRLVGPILLACAGFVLIQATLYSRKLQEESLDANKTLGLSYQGQGMLDMAYERYMQCPVQDASVKNLLYTLGLDFERKRMFNKAL
ncbi:MAG: CHASE2 domain-containing protein, partial [Desulfosarcinaceae bacterium]